MDVPLWSCNVAPHLQDSGIRVDFKSVWGCNVNVCSTIPYVDL